MTSTKEPQADKSALPANKKVFGNDSLTDLIGVVAYPGAIGLGYMAFETSVRSAMYKNFAKHGIFNEMQTGRTHQYKEALAKVAEHGDLPGQVRAIEMQYRDTVKAWFSRHGMKDTKDFWSVLQPNQKSDALVLGATVSGIAIGALLTITQNRNLWNWVAKAEEEKEQEKNGHAR